jgi:hypothetical protein
MTDYVPTGGGGKPRQEQVGSTSVAFVETSWRDTAVAPICYCCGKKCNVAGWKECPNVTKKQRKKVAKLVAQGHFEREHDTNNKDDSSTTSTISTKRSSASGKRTSTKKGAAFAAVEEESEEEDEEAAELPTYEEYLRDMGHIQVNVGRTDREVEGDCVSEFGIGCTEVGDAEHVVTDTGVALAGTGKWMVQGRNGTNPMKKHTKPKEKPEKKV